MWNRYKRWRHTKGYGVHSPFAYRLVTDVLRPGQYAYYAYNAIDFIITPAESSDHKFRQLILLLIRLVNFLGAKRIVASPDATRLAQVVVKATGKECLEMQNLGLGFNQGDIFLTTGDEADISSLNKALNDGAAVFSLHPGKTTRNLLEKPMERGLLLNGRRRMILIPRPEMAYVAYSIVL